MSGILGGLIFSSLGLIALKYGRSRGGPRAMVIGAALIVYPYFMPNTGALYVVGIGLVAAFFLFRD